MSASAGRSIGGAAASLIAIAAAALPAPPAAAMPWGALGVPRPLGMVYTAQPPDWANLRGTPTPHEPAAANAQTPLGNRIAGRVGARIGGGGDRPSADTQPIGRDFEALFAKRYDTLP